MTSSLRYNPCQLSRTTKTQVAIRQAEKIEMTVDDLINRAKELNALYTDLSVKYQGISATRTRYLGITGPATDNQVRQVVYAKFVLASILEWVPSTYGYSIDGWLQAGGPVFKKDATNELCPYWESFFADMLEAALKLEEIMLQPTLAYDELLLKHIDGLLQIAEMKAGWVDSLLRTVDNSASTPGSHAPENEAENYRTWNQFCLNIGNGMSIPDATLQFGQHNNTLHKYHPLPIPLTQATQTRIWFPVEIEAQPWVTHAQAIAQQPHHLLRQKTMQGMYAGEPYLWMLTKTTDTSVAHHECSLTSPCCSRMHVFCPPHSMCKIWGPEDCVHVRAGTVEKGTCADKHCKMVDWGKYNLCEEPGAVASWPSRHIDPLAYHTLIAQDQALRERVMMAKAMA